MQSKPFFTTSQRPVDKDGIDYKAVYTSCFPMVRSMVLKNGGDIDDARDIFQESIIVLFQNNSLEKFQLTVNTCTYVYSIARNKWLQHIRDTGKITRLENKYDSDPTDDFDDDTKKQRQRLLIKHLNHLGDKCRNVLKHYFEGMPGEEIARELEFSSYEYYRVAKNRCTENLKTNMRKDPLFKELL